MGERRKRAIAKSLESLIQEENQMISVYGKEKNLLLGTTVSAVLLIAGWYLIVHVGDSRVYGLTEDVQQLTKDQTYVQREIDAGRLTKEQARQHPRRNVLLQCVGVQEKITPEWKSGVYYPGMGFLVCSDGFCNQLLDGELEERFCRNYLRAEWEMEENLKEVMEQIKDGWRRIIFPRFGFLFNRASVIGEGAAKVRKKWKGGGRCLRTV